MIETPKRTMVRVLAWMIFAVVVVMGMSVGWLRGGLSHALGVAAVAASSFMMGRLR